MITGVQLRRSARYRRQDAPRKPCAARILTSTECDNGTPDPADDAAGSARSGTVVADGKTASADDAATDDDHKTIRAGASVTSEKAARLPSGALRGMVEDFLSDHPGEEFGPVTIAKALGGKSSGAVSNALDKLVDEGVAVKTNDKPRRFALAPAEHAAAQSAS